MTLVRSLYNILVCRVALFSVLGSQGSLYAVLQPHASFQYLDILVCRVALFPVLGSQGSLYAVLQPHAPLKPEQVLATAEYFPLPRMFIIIKKS